VRILVREILGKYGYTIMDAPDGENGINKFNKNRKIELLIIDPVMPKGRYMTRYAKPIPISKLSL
jgi:hypothetical protein